MMTYSRLRLFYCLACAAVLSATLSCQTHPAVKPICQRPYWPTDQWRTAPPETLGLDSEKLLTTEHFLLQFPTHAFLVIRHGYIGYEGYYNGFSSDQLHDSFSIGKSFTAVAIGAAIQNGLIRSEHAALADFIPAARVKTPNTMLYNQITIEHLLTMTSGIDFNNRLNYPEMLNADSHPHYVLQRPILHPPGSHWKYKADPTLLSAVITQVSGKSTAPCRTVSRMACDCWSETPLPISLDQSIEYGYGWWCRKFPGLPDDAFYAFGGKGQFILIIPSLDIVAVRLADDRLKSDHVILPEMARLITQAVKWD